MADITVVNRLGQIAGWKNVTVRALGRDLVGIVKIAYADSFEDEYLMGAQDEPVGYSEGNSLPTASIDLYQEEVNELIDALPPGKKLRDIDAFDIIVSFGYKDRTITDIIRGCKFKGSGKDIGQGSKGIVKSFALNVLRIQENI
jgi:hypothetical protein